MLRSLPSAIDDALDTLYEPTLHSLNAIFSQLLGSACRTFFYFSLFLLHLLVLSFICFPCLLFVLLVFSFVPFPFSFFRLLVFYFLSFTFFFFLFLFSN